MPVFVKGETHILFAHVPKTGGTYIEDLFRANGFKVHFHTRHSLQPVEAVTPQHYHASLLATVFNLKAFTYMFATVRHPFDRLISEYKMRVPTGEVAFSTWAKDTLQQAEDNRCHLDNHMRPQIEFMLPGMRHFKQEAGFGPDFVATLAAQAGLSLDVTDVPRRRDNRAWRAGTGNSLTLDPDTLARFEAFYADDFAAFEYPKSSTN